MFTKEESRKDKLKSPDIGTRQAHRLYDMKFDARLKFIAEGLPLILDSALGFYRASHDLEKHPREAEVLMGFALEEAAKILILMDLVRCPKKLVSSRLGKLMGWFYDHLARLIYAEVYDWRPTDIADLSKGIHPHREAHTLEGSMGEYIIPNSTLYRRESSLYADIEAYDDTGPIWSAPHGHVRPFPNSMRNALRVVEAMSALGLFSVKGLRVVSDVWSEVTFSEKEGPRETKQLTDHLLNRLVAEKLPCEAATQDHVNTLYWHWQFPMYELELRSIVVPIEELRARQERMLWNEMY